MQAEPQVFNTDILGFLSQFFIVIKIAFLILATFYFFFSLIVVRQVQLMTDTLITEVSPLIRAFTIVHAGLALAIIILFIGLL